jgi:CRP/FNR family transcriptional regulator
VVEALSHPVYESGALLALQHLPPAPVPALRAYARESVSRAEHYHDLTRGFESITDDERLSLLADALHAKAHTHAYNALRAVGLMRAEARDTITLAIENLKLRDPAQRANALESLEAMGEREIVRPLLHLWEASEVRAVSDSVEARLSNLLREPEAWVRACAALAARPAHYPGLRTTLTQLAQSDPDALVCVTAKAVLNGDVPMSTETLPTLSPMERILFLRRVPLFADLNPTELKRVASIVNEQIFQDGEMLAQQGESGDQMYIIVSGEVRILVRKNDRPEAEVARRKSGEVVGEMAIISREPRIATMTAAGDVRVLCLDQKSFEGLLRERPDISLAVMRVLCTRLKEATR